LKILVLSQHFWPETFRITDIVRALADAGHNMRVLTGQPNYPAGRIFDGYRAGARGPQAMGGVPVHRVPLVPRGAGGAMRLALNYLSFVASASLFGPRDVPGRKLDIVFVYATSPLIQAIAGVVVARAKRAKLVVWVQDLWPESLAATGFVTSPALLGLVARVVRWIYARTDLILVQSEAFVAPVAALAPHGRIALLENPSDAPAPQATAAAPALHLRPGFNIVFAGNFGAAQSLDTVLDAAELLRDLSDLRFVLVGSGRDSARLADAIARRRLTNVEMPGRFPPEVMPAIFAQASALLVTLARAPIFALTVPSKVQTYLAAGRPILAALDGEGARVIAQAGAGLCVPAEDAAALASAVRALYATGAEERAAMGARGQAHHEQHYDMNVFVPRLIGMLETLIEARAA